VKNAIKEKLKKIKDLYPEEKLNARKERWRRMWRGEPALDRYPFVFYPPIVDYYNTVYAREDRLNLFLDEFILRGMLEEDFIPAFFPGCRQATIPGMFGAKEVILNDDYSCEHIIFKAEDINDLPEPSFVEGSPAQGWLEMEKFFIEECEGQIPVHVCDMQGPMDVAGQLCGYDDLFTYAYEETELFNKLLSSVVKAFKLLWDTQKKLCGDLFIGTHMYGWTWVPDHIAGASMSADCMAMLSPLFFKEHYVPYIRELGQYYNGVIVHSCGNFSAVMKILTEIPEVKAVNASQMTPQMIHAAGWNPEKVIITKEDYDKTEDIFKYIKENKLRVEFCIRELWETADKGLAKNPDAWTAETIGEIKKRNREIINWVTF
jgi:hypothetical protein